MASDTPDDPSNRRRHVRVRPIPAHPATIQHIPDDGTIVHIVDISLGGLGLFVQRGAPCEKGQKIRYKLGLGKATIELDALVRYANRDGAVGIEFCELAKETRSVINDYVSELAERGSR